MKRKLHLKSMFLAAMLCMGTSAWGQELTAVTTETTWDFATLSFTSSAEGQFLQDNTIYVGANISRDGTNGRTQFTSNYTTTVTDLGANIIAIKTGAAGQLIMRISSYYGSIVVSDGTNTTTFASGGGYHGGSLAYLRAALDVEADKTYYIYTNKTDVKNSDNVGIFKIMYLPLENTTVAFSSTEEVTKTFTDYPRLNNGTEDITYKGITYDNVYMGNGVKYNTVSGKERMLLGEATTGPLPTQNYMSFKLPKGKGKLTIKASSYNATVKMSDGTNVLVESFTHGDPANVYNYESETETTLYYYATSYNANQYTGIFYLTWTPTTYDYTINAVDGNGAILQELGSGKAMEGYTYSLSGLPKVIVKDGKYYVLNDGTVTNFATQNYTMGIEDEIRSITYTEDASIVYFAEVEDLGNATGVTTGNYSGGKFAAVNSGKYGTLKEFDAGNYQVEGFIVGHDNRGLYLRSSASNTNESVVTYIGNVTGLRTANFTLASSITLYLSGYTTGTNQVNRSADIDYIIIRRTNVPVTITAAKYATYCSPYALDFSATGATVYKAKASGSTVTLTAVAGGQVPANTGIILYKDVDSDTEITPTTIASAAAIGDNELVGVTSDTEVAYNPSTGIYNYILQNQGGDLGFYKATGAKIRANRAYLNTAVDVTALGAPSLSIVFDDGNFTSIGEEVSVKSMKANDGVYYNLSGQRVAQPTKGLYIINGRKVIFK